ncbi:heterokaryon incompatibility protein-domain-containing protein [Cladorrhinum sp. PSN259]|nr:heterokaryon incompatibility protein-domain-containing protein [Cladorrhinum sp. PSN259]
MACNPSNTDKTLCRKCIELTTYETLSEIQLGGVFKHNSIRVVFDMASASKPCTMCHKLQYALQEMKDLNPDHFILLRNLHFDVETKSNKCRGEFHISTSKDGKRFPVYRSSLRIYTEEGMSLFRLRYLIWHSTCNTPRVEVGFSYDPASAMTNFRPIPLDVASERVFTMTRSWLRTCADTHPDCENKDATRLLPTRLIDVDPGVPGISARLIMPAQGEEAIEYLCLSYCWGGRQKVEATQETVQSLSELIPIDNLGLTIQDAIETTRRLGFRYLWVDAICIVQDDNTEIAAEICKMASIYKNAYAVIFAATASNSNEGFLRTPRGPHFEGYDFQITLPGGAIGNLTFATRECRSYQHPLDTRAWAFQEKILSRRKLVFSVLELLVGCQDGYERPLVPSLLAYDNHNLAAHYFSSIMRREARTRQEGITPGVWEWGELIRRYTSRSLTNSNDRLNAFQGIIQELTRHTNELSRFGTILSMPVTLAWRTLLPAPNRSTRAPTWSWGCLDVPVESVCEGSLDGDAQLQFSGQDDGRSLVVVGNVINGAEWGREHPGIAQEGDRHGIFPDVETDFPSPRDLTYLRVVSDVVQDVVLVLATAGNGRYRRVGIYWGVDFRQKGKLWCTYWDSNPTEVTII